MALNLPALRKGASIARPKRGRHGVFANGADDGFDEWKPSVLSDMSTWSQAPSWISATSSPSRSLAPFASEDDLELAPKGWARQIQPVDCNMQVVRENCQGLAEAKRALRGLKPGDWKADAFAYYRKKLKDEGRWLALPQLREAVQKSSEEALKEGCYCLPTDKRAQVRLPQKPNVCWVSMESCVEPEPCQGQAPPPLVISHKTPLEAAGALAKTFKGHPVIVTMEATDFIRSEGELNGRLQEAEAGIGRAHG
ncbi:unnamed protein product [Effrenium voratum]|nr:unnamed protein product [Effrenium voratum]